MIICLKSCLAVALPCGLNYPLGEVLLNMRGLSPAVVGIQGQPQGPPRPRVTRVERSPASREAAKASGHLEGGGCSLSLHHTFKKMALFAFKEKLRRAWPLVSA